MVAKKSSIPSTKATPKTAHSSADAAKKLYGDGSSSKPPVSNAPKPVGKK